MNGFTAVGKYKLHEGKEENCLYIREALGKSVGRVFV